MVSNSQIKKIVGNKTFKKKYKLNVKLINASKMFLNKLRNISDPEKKRKIIGNLLKQKVVQRFLLILTLK